jgi:hypothetical protein
MRDNKSHENFSPYVVGLFRELKGPSRNIAAKTPRPPPKLSGNAADGAGKIKTQVPSSK